MLKLSEGQPRKKKFNPYAPLFVMANHPFWTAFIGVWVLTAVLLAVGIPLQNDAMVGTAMVLGYVAFVFSLGMGLISLGGWLGDGGWDRFRHNLRDKMDNYDRIED